MQADQTPEIHADWALIQSLGGVVKVADMLGASVQRVQNWKSRGIPSDVKLSRPDLFLPQLRPVRAKPATPTAKAA